MSIQRAPGAFRSFGSILNPNLADTNFQPGADGGFSQRTLGATLIDQSSLNPSLPAGWTIEAFSVTANLFILNNNLTVPLFGQLGKLIATLIVDSGGNVTHSNSVGAPFTVPMLPLSTDGTLSVTVWDGAQDPVPPQYALTATPPSQFLPVAANLILNNPIRILSGQQVSIGLWLTPSLISFLGNNGLIVTQAAYSITFDDGQS
jgi:hypothetical protein